MAGKSLMDLPPEIREKILLSLLVTTQPVSRVRINPPQGPSVPKYVKNFNELYPEILRACKQLYEEGRWILYEQNTWLLHMLYDDWMSPITYLTPYLLDNSVVRVDDPRGDEQAPGMPAAVLRDTKSFVFAIHFDGSTRNLSGYVPVLPRTVSRHLSGDKHIEIRIDSKFDQELADPDVIKRMLWYLAPLGAISCHKAEVTIQGREALPALSALMMRDTPVDEVLPHMVKAFRNFATRMEASPYFPHRLSIAAREAAYNLDVDEFKRLRAEVCAIVDRIY